VIEREMLAPLSEELNQQQHDAALTLNVWTENESLKFSVQPSFDSSGKQAHMYLVDRSMADLARQCIYIRRDARRLESSSIVLNLRNDIFITERAEMRLAKQKWKNPADLERISELPKLKSALKEIHDFAARITRLENEASLTVYGKAEKDYKDLGSQLVAAQKEWNKLLISTYSLKFKNPDSITIAIFSEAPHVLFTLAGAYYKLAINHGAIMEADAFTLRRAKKTGPVPGFERKRIEKIEGFLASPGEAVIGIALGINAPFACPLFDAERGLHLFIREKKSSKCLVQTSGSTISEYHPPDGIERHGAIGHQEKRRSYHLDQSLIDDAFIKKQLPWSGRAIDQAIGELIEECLMAQARALIDG
jgi:hypothetical protein